ncbi:helix-turn-helix domain-containing protein [Kitasatospora sp. NPDC086791]|uniref:TetR/AcrR family transcriptional regulator n=1 Tax=Kitasatospora sp. NPDC086791 TaxID=3155178 RepID=UPI00342F2806
MARTSQRPAIHAAALACFAERGYDATRTRHIAERAGVSEAALYRHYPSKEAIARELYTEAVQGYALALSAVADGPGTAVERLAGVVRAMLAAYRRRPHAFLFALYNTGSLMPRLPEGSAYPLHVIERLITQAQREGEVRDGPANLLAAVFAGCVLQPITVATLSRAGALDLLTGTAHDHIIEEAALAAVRSHPRAVDDH